MKKPLISIIIPCYNSEKNIANTISSVLDQTYDNYEIIIVDDVSTDKTFEICSKLAEKNNKIKCFKLEKNSGGPSYPSNFGVSKASGDYVAFLDHDDIWFPNKLEKQVSLLVDKNLDMVSSYVTSVDTNNKEQTIKIIQESSYLAEILQRNFLTTLSTIVVKKEVFEKIGGFDISLKGPQDWDFYINFFSKGFTFDYVKETLAKHMGSEANISATITFDKFEKDRLYIFNKYKKFYEADKKIYSNYLRSVGIQYLSLNNKKEAFKMIL
jgi:glycosyltransferase involved in cell wall biosynthesis